MSVDRYSAYKRLAKDTELVLSFCWVHVRRDFITIANERDDQEEWAEQWLADIAALYHLNDERLQVRAEPTQYAAADAALRAGVQAMQQRRERELAQQPKLPAACAKVLRSLRNHWQGLTLFVEDPTCRWTTIKPSARCAAGGAQELLRLGGAVERRIERFAVQPVPHAGTVADQPAHLADRVSERLCGRRGRVPADFERFLPWNRRAARVPRASPAQVVDSRAA